MTSTQSSSFIPIGTPIPIMHIPAPVMPMMQVPILPTTPVMQTARLTPPVLPVIPMIQNVRLTPPVLQVTDMMQTVRSTPTVFPVMRTPISPIMRAPIFSVTQTASVLPVTRISPLRSLIDARPMDFSMAVPIPKPISLTLNIVRSNGLVMQIAKNKEDLAKMGRERLSPYQNEIVDECMIKGSAGLSLPMGTGKTIISTIVSLQQSINYPNSKILIVVAKSLINGWRDEFHKFFGDNIRYEILHTEYVKNINMWVPQTDIIITTPEVLSKAFVKYNVDNHFSYNERADNNFAPEIKYYRVPENPYVNYKQGDGILFSIKWGSVIIDEAHNYLNLTSNRCLALCALSAHHRWALSGTLLAEPAPKKLLGYCLLINNTNFPRNLPAFFQYINEDDFTGLADTMIIREGNPDFVPPPINKIIVSHSLSEIEASIYTNVKGILNILKNRLKEFRANGDRVNTKKFSSYIMGMISHMRQCLICPLIPITTVAIDVADFEQRSELSEMFMNHINNMGIDNWLSDVNSLYSSRIRSVCEKVNLHPNERIIIFSCYRTVLDVITLYLPKDRQVFTISGNDKIETRNKTIENYRLCPNGILLLTYEIGANGLNLQCSSTAILVDFWWNIDKSDQAIARLCRPGQNADILNIYYMTANSGMENALFRLQTSKVAMGEEVLTGRITTDREKIKMDDIIRLMDIEDNITILDNLIA